MKAGAKSLELKIIQETAETKAESIQVIAQSRNVTLKWAAGIVGSFMLTNAGVILGTVFALAK